MIRTPMEKAITWPRLTGSAPEMRRRSTVTAYKYDPSSSRHTATTTRCRSQSSHSYPPICSSGKAKPPSEQAGAEGCQHHHEERPGQHQTADEQRRQEAVI